MSELASRRFLVEGLVQGVGFRAFVRRQATTLGLSGFAQNQPDGSVLVEASGPPAGLDALASALRRGPSIGRVDRVQSSEIPLEGALTNRFDIR